MQQLLNQQKSNSQFLDEDIDNFKKEISIELAENYLIDFVEQAWHVVEPETPFVGGWHLDAICEHLTAVTNGEILRLLINIPPRCTKSLSVSVFWPCWEWIGSPAGRWLFSSYAQDLSTRDSLKCRRLIQSKWYQERWGDRFRITSDQNQKMRFENDKTGYRIATSVGGINTGEGGDKVVTDDPHNIKEGESVPKRQGVLLWWDEVMSTRLNDPNTGAKVIIMQRTHEQDLSGHVLEKEGGYVHLCLPFRYEGNRVKTSLPFEDPRIEKDEPLCPERFSDEILTALENEMGEYAWAGQGQQSPHPRGGGMFKVEKFRLVNAIPNQISRSVRYWDKAATEGGGAYSAGVLMHKLADGTFCVGDVVKGQWTFARREARIKLVAELDGTSVTVWTEQEGGSGGKESAESTIKNLAGFACKADRVTGSKETRAEPYSIQVEAGNVSVLNKDWTREFIDEHEKFPTGKYKDQVDAAAGAFAKLNRPEKRFGTWGRR